LLLFAYSEKEDELGAAQHKGDSRLSQGFSSGGVSVIAAAEDRGSGGEMAKWEKKWAPGFWPWSKNKEREGRNRIHHFT
jgi:hypothetical protein